MGAAIALTRQVEDRHDERADDACARHQLVRESQSDDERGHERRRDGGIVPETRRRVVPPAGGMATPVHHRAQRDDDGTATIAPLSLYWAGLSVLCDFRAGLSR